MVTALEETESLMRDMKTYMVELQRSPSSTLFHLVRPDSIVRIVQRFSEDMELLGKELPGGAVPSASEKISFVLNRKSLKNLIQRLEERKSSVTVILGIIGRYDTPRGTHVSRLTLLERVMSKFGTKSSPFVAMSLLLQPVKMRYPGKSTTKATASPVGYRQHLRHKSSASTAFVPRWMATHSVRTRCLEILTASTISLSTGYKQYTKRRRSRLSRYKRPFRAWQ